MPGRVKAAEKDIRDVFDRLSRDYPDPSTELVYEGPFQLLVAVILSAQCTDARVNLTTPALFARYPTAKALASADTADVERLIKSCGFFRMKAKAIVAAARDIVEKFGGEVPGRLDDLVTLAGVGRKTASVVLNQAFDVPAIAVDTHVKRVTHRLGWATHPHPEKIELELRALLPIDLWGTLNGLLVLHGRRVCKARKPLCGSCSVTAHCAYFQSLGKGGAKLVKPKAAAKARAPRAASRS